MRSSRQRACAGLQQHSFSPQRHRVLTSGNTIVSSPARCMSAAKERRQLRHILLLGAFLVAATLPAGALEILGSGSTFAYPVLTKWSEAYEKIGGVRIAYQ